MRAMYIRSDVHKMRLMIAGAAIVGGGVLTSMFEVWGLFVLVPALFGGIAVWWRRSRPLVTVDDATLTIQMGTPQTVRLGSVVRAVKTADSMFEIQLKDGKTVSIPIGNLEDDDAVHLGRMLKRQVSR